jgi:hypothetical protein
MKITKKINIIVLLNIIMFMTIKSFISNASRLFINNIKGQFSGLPRQEKLKLGATAGAFTFSFPWLFDEIMIKGQPPEQKSAYLKNLEKERLIERDKYIESLNNDIKNIKQEGIKDDTAMLATANKLGKIKANPNQYLTPEEQEKYYNTYYNILYPKTEPTQSKSFLKIASVAIIGYLGFKLIKKILARKKLIPEKIIIPPSNSVKVLQNNEPKTLLAT